MNSQIFKIVVLGEGRVGKTSISLKYVNNEFNEDQESTINASYLEKKLVLQNHQSVKLAIWVGLKAHRILLVKRIYYREAMGAVVTYDITSAESLDKVKKWISELKEHAPKDIVLTIAGNKADLENLRKVNVKAVEQYAQSHQAGHMLVSAKSGLNVNELFQDLSERIYKVNFDGKVKNNRLRKNPKLILDSKQVQKQKQGKEKKCCS